MSEQEIKQQIFDLEDEQLKNFKNLKLNNIDEFNLFFKLKNSQEIKNAMIRQCIKKTLDDFLSKYFLDTQNILFYSNIFINYKNNIELYSSNLSTNKNFEENLLSIKTLKLIFDINEIKNFMDSSTNDVCQKYLIEHEKYTENLVIKILTKEKHNDTFICVFISLK